MKLNWVLFRTGALDNSSPIPPAKLPAPSTGGITSVVAGTGLSGGGSTSAVTLNVENPFTAADEQKLDRLSDIGLRTVSSGTLTTVAVAGGDIEATRIPGETAAGSFTGDGDLLQVRLATATGAMSLVLTGLANKYTGRTFELGGRRVEFSQANPLPDGVNNRITYVFMGDYNNWAPVRNARLGCTSTVGPSHE